MSRSEVNNTTNARDIRDSAHAEYIKQNEYEAAELLLERIKARNSDSTILSLGDFAKEAYQRVGEIFEWDDFESCRNLVMIGCGPLPVTALHVADKYPAIKIYALDADAKALKVAQRVIDALEVGQISFIHDDSVSYEFAFASIIYIANLVRPKREVLRQISKTAAPGTLVVLRDPTRAGTAVAEAGIDHLGSSYKIEGFGEDNDVFMSKHVYLRLVERN